jgi:hypothetical protein
LTIHNTDALEAVPINRLICPSTSLTVGYEYRWNNGDLAVLWLGAEYEDVIRISLKDEIE